MKLNKFITTLLLTTLVGLVIMSTQAKANDVKFGIGGEYMQLNTEEGVSADLLSRFTPDAAPANANGYTSVATTSQSMLSPRAMAIATVGRVSVVGSIGALKGTNKAGTHWTTTEFTLDNFGNKIREKNKDGTPAVNADGSPKYKTHEKPHGKTYVSEDFTSLVGSVGANVKVATVQGIDLNVGAKVMGGKFNGDATVDTVLGLGTVSGTMKNGYFELGVGKDLVTASASLLF